MSAPASIRIASDVFEESGRRLPVPPLNEHPEGMLRELLRQVGLDDVAREVLDDARRFTGLCYVAHKGILRGWRVERAVVTIRKRGKGWLSDGLPVCDCRDRAPCAHLVALTLALGWIDPATRPLLDRPSWKRSLDGLIRPANKVEDDERGTDEGYLQYALVSDLRGRLARIDRALVRLSGSRVLKPRALEEPVSHLARRVRGVGSLDLSIDWLLTEAETARRAARQVDEELAPTLSALADDKLLAAVDLLADARRVVADGLPISVSTERVSPRLIASDRPDGGLDLAWSPAAREAFNVGPGLIVTEGGVLHQLTPGGPPARQLTDALPPVPADALPEFASGFLPFASAHVELRTTRLSFDARARLLRPELLLTPDGQGIRVEARFRYGDPESSGVVLERDPAPVVRVPRGGSFVVVRRDADAEARHLRRVTAASGPLPARLTGDRACDFLLDTVPALEDEWTVLASGQLLGGPIVGEADARVRVPSGIDWFDINVDFEIEGRVVPVDLALAALRDGRRWVTLDDGALVRLPEEWLAQHGDTLIQLEEIRAASGGRLGAHTLPLVTELLGQVHQEREAERWRDLGRRLQDFERISDRAVPETVQATLRDYQHRGFRWLRALWDLHLGGCLADDMGLGKTLQTLTFLADTAASEPGPTLIVAPTSVIHNWRAEAAKFVPHFSVALYYGPDRPSPRTLKDHDLVITSYALLRLDADALCAVDWRVVVLDEAQAIKNPTSQVARAARRLPSRHRFALTGTPLENDLFELWSLFEFLMPGFFGTQASFARRYATPIQRDQDQRATAALRRRIRPFVLRRLKSEVVKELPPLTEVILRCELTEAQRRVYEGVKAAYRERILTEAAGQPSGLHVLEALMRLRQACCHPSLVPVPEADGVTESAKLDLLFETLDEACAEGHRTLVFSQWPSLLDLVVPELERRGITHLRLDGATKRRELLVDAWNAEDGPPVFLISLKAGGTGLNLTAADHVIHLDPWWNPAAEAQATGRAHRIGQHRPVVAYKLVATGTVEEKVLELQERKRALFEAAVDTDRALVDTLTRDDLVELLS